MTEITHAEFVELRNEVRGIVRWVIGIGFGTVVAVAAIVGVYTGVVTLALR